MELVGSVFRPSQRACLMVLMRRLSLVVLLLCGLSQTTLGGTVRYELPHLLGEHRFDGTDSFFGSGNGIQTPFGYYSVHEARLVIEGTSQPGKARGDGVLREPIEYELPARIGVSFTTMAGSFATGFRRETTSPFSIERIYPFPFVPEVIPLPSPVGHPPATFFTDILVSTNSSTVFPAPIDANSAEIRDWDGIIIDVPVTAHITKAYIEFSGPEIVPEPSAFSAALSGLFLFMYRMRRGGLWIAS
jgi:hypothetical protein